ncbi:bacterial translation initiation factor 3 (bIF-3) [Thalassospira xiamenensis]|uniref:Translation initiation factor IF-3 n=4 Tax=Thalassospira TaxID=168934 RepID=A0A285T9J5_9PROT|nr:bacterial translation initiation factor 3 (bIF-3) [Thalassospira xiamenensis]
MHDGTCGPVTFCVTRDLFLCFLFDYQRRLSIARPRKPMQPTKDGPRVNEDIKARAICVVDAEGNMSDPMTVREGIEMAMEAGLDLVEVAPNAEPPVCKLIDYGKFKYEQSKKQNEAKKKQKVIEVKEIKLRPNIDTHDYNVKLRAAQKFLGGGDKVKVTLRFRGREMAHQDLGLGMLQRFSGDLEDLAKTEQMPKMEGRIMIMVLAPR